MSEKKNSTATNTTAAASTTTASNDNKDNKKKTPKQKLKEVRPQKQPWTLEKAMRIGKQYSSESAWFSGSPSSYKSASAHGWVAKIVSQMNQATNNVVKLPTKKSGSGSPLKKAA